MTLIEEFGSLGATLAASREARERICGKTEAVGRLECLRAACEALVARQIEERPVIKNWEMLHDYLHARMAHRLNESARVLHLNTKNVLIRDELMSDGSVDQAPIYVREIARRALELGSAAVILVHNHPSGDPAPSRQDIALTREVVAALRPLGIHVHDHIIVGLQGHSSLRGMGAI